MLKQVLYSRTGEGASCWVSITLQASLMAKQRARLEVVAADQVAFRCCCELIVRRLSLTDSAIWAFRSDGGGSEVSAQEVVQHGQRFRA